MNETLILQTEALSSQDAQWWPDLYLKKGRKLMQIQPEQCAAVRDIFNAGRGASGIRRELTLHDISGERIGYVSYNGRVWLHDIESDVEVPARRQSTGCFEVPVAGRKTCAQLDAEGWQ